MSEANIVRLGAAPTEKEKEVLRRVLFEYVNGYTDDDRKKWARMWKHLMNMGPGQIYKIDFTIPRNVKFHRKFFALLQFAYSNWEPDMGKGTRSFETFREELTILAGYYEQHIKIDGSILLKAKSISFGSMDDVAFEGLYNAVATVILNCVLTDYTRADLDNVIDQAVSFL